MSGSTSIFDMLTDPGTNALMGLAQGFGQASMPTRMPTPLAATLGMGIGGMQQGLATGQGLRRGDIQNQQAKIGLDAYKNMTGGASAPFGAPGAGGDANSQYMVSPAALHQMALVAIAQGKDPSGPLKLLEQYATSGRRITPRGEIDMIPGGAAAIEAESYAKGRGDVGGRTNAPQKPDAYVIQVPDSQGRPPGAAGYESTTATRYMTPQQANDGAGYGGSGGARDGATPASNSTQPTDPRSAAVNAMNSIPDPKVRAMVANAIFKRGLPIEAVAPFIAMTHRESGWNPDVKDGTSGEIGLGQIMPGTGKMFGYSPDQLRDPQTNLDAAVGYFGQKWLESKANPTGAITGYNSGSVNGTPTHGHLEDIMPRLAKYGYPGVATPQPTVQVAGPGAPTGFAPVTPMAGAPAAVQQQGMAGAPVLTPQQNAQLEIDKARRMPTKLSPGETALNNPYAASGQPPDPSSGLDGPAPAPVQPLQTGDVSTHGTGESGVAMPHVPGGGVEAPYGPLHEIAPRQKVVTELQTKANEARFEIQQATLLKQQMHALDTTGPATPFLANLARYAAQAGVSPETIKSLSLPDGGTETQAAALANSLMMEVAKANFPARVTNADLQVAKTVKPNPAMPLGAADFLIDNTIVPHAQRDIDRYHEIVPLTMPKLPNGSPNPKYDRELRSIHGVLEEFDARKPPTSYTPALQSPAPSSAAIEHLTKNPSLAAQFDSKFGPGASKQYLNGH